MKTCFLFCFVIGFYFIRLMTGLKLKIHLPHLFKYWGLRGGSHLAKPTGLQFGMPLRRPGLPSCSFFSETGSS